MTNLNNWETTKSHFIQEISPLLYETNEAESLFFMILDYRFNISRADYIIHKKEFPKAEHLESLESILKELKKERPIQHILNKAFCYECEFEVNPSVLIPRQETEELIHLILNRHSDTKLNILDIGTGSGCIAINLKKQRPDWQVQAFDISEQALEVAQRNAHSNQTDIHFKTINILDQQNWSLIPNSSLDLVISNPPYVMMKEKQKMRNNVLLHDPHLALFVEDDNPLIFYEKISDFACLKLKPHSWIYFEINEQLGQETLNLLTQKGFTKASLLQDMQGKDRMVYAKWE